MAGTTITTPGIASSSPSLLLSSSSPPAIPPPPHRTTLLLPFHLPSWRNHRTITETWFTKNPRRISIRHTKALNSTVTSRGGGGGGGPEGIEEAFFDEEIEEESEEDEDDDDDETEESSMDLLFRFLQSMFNKLSKRAKKATRSMLPPVISPQLVSFAVDGVLLLTLLSIVKALLQVVCTLGGTVFVVILLLRVIWATASHFQSIGNSFDQKGGGSYGSTTQPSM